ncbi:MAG TPA: histidine kinase [Pseudonocardiaceae bacterium]|jgi:two-component system sensor histidine kinase DesK|nr:histidine kinase [Pseudonocardiaceae bacterium]
MSAITATTTTTTATGSRWERGAAAAGTDEKRPEHAKRVIWVRRAVSAFAVVMLIYLVLPIVTTLAYTPNQPHLPLLAAAAVVFGLCHLLIVRLDPAGWQRSLQGGALGVQAALTFLIPVFGGIAWLGLGSYLIGSLGIVLRPRLAAPLALVAVAGLTVLMVAQQVGTTEILLLHLQNVITGVCIAGGVRVGTLTLDLFAARDESAALAVDNERLRFSRDLHDVLGHSLSAIALKAELTARLLDLRPEAAATELDTIRDIAAKSLTDVRAVAKGYRSLNLGREAGALISVLRSAGVQVADLAVPEDLPAGAADVLAWALREGVTNVLRHATATKVELSCARDGSDIVLHLGNDGVGAAKPRTDAVGGNGLAGLSERVNAVGGQLITGSPRNDWFALTVRIPDDTKRIPDVPNSGGNNPIVSRTEQSGSAVPVLASTSRGQDMRGSRR